MRALGLAWRNLISKPLQLLLSLVLFALGVAMISILILLNKQVKEKFDNNQAGINMVVGAKGSPLQMVLCNMFHVDSPTGNISLEEAKSYLNPKHPLIEKAVPLSLGDSYRNSRIVGTNTNFIDLYKLEIQEGEWFKEDFEVNIGAEVAAKAGLEIGDEFDSSHGFSDDDGLEHEHHTKFKVVGIIKGSGTVADQLILCTTKTVWEVHGGGHEHELEELQGDEMGKHDHSNSNADLLHHLDQSITSILTQFKNKTSIAALNFPRAINDNTGLLAVNPVYEINRLYGMMGIGIDSLRKLALIIVFVSGLSIFISLYNALRERKFELSLLRVMGATPVTLSIIIIAEGLWIALLGYFFGIVFSHLGMYFMAEGMESSFKYSFSAFQFYREEFLLLLGSLGLGFLASLLPAIKAYRTDIHKVLSER